MRVSQQHKRNGLVGLVTTTLTSLLLLPLLLLLLLAEAANAAPQQQPGPVANNSSTEGWTLAQYPNPTKVRLIEGHVIKAINRSITDRSTDKLALPAGRGANLRPLPQRAHLLPLRP